MKKQDPNKDYYIDEIRRCQDPWYFITTYVKTAPPGKPPKSVPRWDFLHDLIKALYEEQFLIILKSRQMMITWLVVIYCMWEAMMNESILTIFVSYRQSEVQEMIKRAQFVYNNLPPFLQLTIGTSNKKEMEFPTRNSRLLALPSVKQGSTRSYSASRIVMDEAAFIEGAEEFYAGARPSLADTGKIVLLSSSKGISNWFGKIWTGIRTDFSEVSREGVKGL